VNSARYRNYLFILDVVSSDVFTDIEREILRDAAEGMLLAHDPCDEVEEMAIEVTAVLDEMVARERLRRATAAELRARIGDCGPAGAALLTA
jgi:hypothetical protein